jgi:DNA helicase-2/ATP-dependent DNA helicase PcrA
MTLHAAKGLEFETVFLPGWEEGLFPHQRALDEGGRSGLEEERRLAYVGLTRAKRHCHIWFVSNRRIHGLWQSTVPSRFLDELPEAHVEVAEPATAAMAATAPTAPRASTRPNLSLGNRSSPGWQRAQQQPHRRDSENWGTRSGHAVERIGYGETIRAATAPAANRCAAASSRANSSPNPSPTPRRPSRSATASST